MNTIEELNAIAREELAKIKGKELGNKERMAIPQQEMPSRNPKERARQMANAEFVRFFKNSLINNRQDQQGNTSKNAPIWGI